MKTLLLELILFLPLTLFAQDAFQQDVFYAANQSYAEGRFEDAKNAYEALLLREGWEPEVLYNLGNTYNQLERTGRAVLNYKRALYLQPRNRDAQTNLDITLQDAGLYTEENSGIRKLMKHLSLNEWSYLLSAAFAVAALLTLWRSLSLLASLKTNWQEPPHGGPRTILLYLAIVVMALSALGILFERDILTEAVVLEKDCQLLVSPFEGASRILSLREGQLVEVAQVFAEFVFVREPSGQSGWVARSAIEQVIK